jgi:hypothetical protein
VYVGSDECQFEDPLSFRLTVCHVGRHPFFSVHDPSHWQETRDLDAPLAELETRFIIFTVPSAFVRALPDPATAANRVDVSVNRLLRFTSDDSVSPYRVVFDVTVTDSMINGQTIVLPIEAMDEIFVNESPSVALLSMFQLIAERSIPPLGFPTNARSALASLATYSAAESVCPVEDFSGMLRAKAPFSHQWYRYMRHPIRRRFQPLLQTFEQK